MGIVKKVAVVPTCRYEHGPLRKIVVQNPKKPGAVIRFGWAGSNEPGWQFEGELFTCSTCGYTEFFDDEFDLTAREDLESAPAGGEED